MDFKTRQLDLSKGPLQVRQHKVIFSEIDPKTGVKKGHINWPRPVGLLRLRAETPTLRRAGTNDENWYFG
jgi:hypothetical protein